MRTVTPDQQFWLAPHVRACASDGQVILLDLRKSAYLAIAQCDALEDRVDGWPRSADFVRAGIISGSANRTLLTLLERGLVTDTPSKRPRQATVAEVTSSLNAEDNAPDRGIETRRLARLLLSAVQTTVWLRFRSLQAIATAVRDRRNRLRSPSTPCSLESVRTGTAAYERLRPFALSAHNNCLHDSLTLVAFLACEGAFPRWVIGVKTRPFGAHAWVQQGVTVLNDQHEVVRQFRPILVV